MVSGEHRTQILLELMGEEQAEDTQVLASVLSQRRERLSLQKQEVFQFLERMTEFLAEAFGEDLEMADWLHGLRNHGDFASIGYESAGRKRLLEQKEQEERLRKKIAEMEGLYETADRK